MTAASAAVLMNVGSDEFVFVACLRHSVTSPIYRLHPSGQPLAVLIRSSRISQATLRITSCNSPFGPRFARSNLLPANLVGSVCAPGNFFEPGVRTRSSLSAIHKKAPIRGLFTPSSSFPRKRKSSVFKTAVGIIRRVLAPHPAGSLRS